MADDYREIPLPGPGGGVLRVPAALTFDDDRITAPGGLCAPLSAAYDTGPLLGLGLNMADLLVDGGVFSTPRGAIRFFAPPPPVGWPKRFQLGAVPDGVQGVIDRRWHRSRRVRATFRRYRAKARDAQRGWRGELVEPDDYED